MTPPLPRGTPRPDDRPAPHAVIIGSGFGGLAAAIRLGARGYQVTVLERLDAPGGRAYVFHQDGFTWVGFEQLGHVPFNTVWDMARIAPDMVRLGSYRSVYGLVSKHIKDPRLRMVLSFLERRWGVHSAMGGTGSLVRGLVGLIEGQGGGFAAAPR